MTPKLEAAIRTIVDQIKVIDESQRELLFIFLKTFVRDFALAWAVRGGVSFLSHMVKLIQLKEFNLLEPIRLSFGVTAGRFGLFLALYFALFKILEKIARHYRKKNDSWNAFIAGAIASLSLVMEEEGTRWILAQYLLVRALGCAWSNFQAKHPQLDPYAYYGDALLFALCSGQAVYCYVVRPETVDPAYSHFLTKVTQMDPLVIDLFRSRVRTGGLDRQILAKIVAKAAAKSKLLSLNGVDVSKVLVEQAHHINCSLIHPGKACIERILWILYANFKSVFPMYFSLHLVPALLLKSKSALSNLNGTLINALKNGIRSSGFMSAYVFIFQMILCTQRNLMDADIIQNEWRYSFWWMGFMSAASIFIEKKQRRAELALYMLSRSGVSLYRSWIEKGWAKHVKHGELFLFSMAMAILMKAFRKDEKQLSSIVSRILRQFLY